MEIISTQASSNKRKRKSSSQPLRGWMTSPITGLLQHLTFGIMTLKTGIQRPFLHELQQPSCFKTQIRPLKHLLWIMRLKHVAEALFLGEKKLPLVWTEPRLWWGFRLFRWFDCRLWLSFSCLDKLFTHGVVWLFTSINDTETIQGRFFSCLFNVNIVVFLLYLTHNCFLKDLHF